MSTEANPQHAGPNLWNILACWATQGVCVCVSVAVCVRVQEYMYFRGVSKLFF